MKRSLVAVVCTSVLLSVTHLPADDENVSVAMGERTLLVKFCPGVIPEGHYYYRVQDISDNVLRETLSEFDVKGLQSVFKNRYDEQGKLKEDVSRSGRKLLSGWFQLRLEIEFEASELLTFLKQHSSVVDAFVEVTLNLQSDIAPNDASYGVQWHLNNPSNPMFDIDAENAWDINLGRDDVILAILDGGVDYSHPDLDPGNRTRVIQGIDTGDDDNDPMDDLSGDGFAGHGTMVAGVIAARTNNGNQVAGVMWNCSIMPIKMVRSGGIRIPHIFDWDWSKAAFPSDVADAIDYAVNHGADVINLSYSFPDMGWPVNEVALRLPLLFDAISNAYQNNLVITTSMGNQFSSDNSVRYPAGFVEQVIAVGATDGNGTKAIFSNTGTHIDISAPGVGIWTTERGGGIYNPSGTSFSAPIAAGVAGLVVSQGRDRGYSLTNDDVRHIMELTATDVNSVGFDNETGHGVVNAGQALQLIDEPNVLYHYNSVGGSAVKLSTISPWILLDNRWGIAAGSYYQVDQYRITKHVTFDVPFCTAPNVWMRERESQSMNFGNPNNSRPYVSITNVTATGFDLEYAAYYVRYDASGRTINQWLPTAPSSTNVAYTAVGVPNLAALATVTGPSALCYSNETFNLQDAPPGATFTWSHGTGVAYVSGQGTSSYTVRATTAGISFVQCVIQTSCGSTTVRKDITLNAPTPVIFGPRDVNDHTTVEYYTTIPANGYEWSVTNGFIVGGQGTNSVDVKTNCLTAGYMNVSLRITTTCGTSPWNLISAGCYPEEGGHFAGVTVFPNPANETLMIETGSVEDKHIVLRNAHEEVRVMNTNEPTIKMDVKGLSPGVYYLVIRTGPSEKSRRLIIQ